MHFRFFGGVALAFLALSFLATAAVAESPATSVAIGKAAPDITMTGIDGKEFKLSDVAKRGKNVALMFSRAHW